MSRMTFADKQVRLNLLVILLIHTILPVSITAVDRPAAITYREISTYRADLIWFYPDVNATTGFYDDGSFDVPFAIREDDRRNSVAVRFEFESSPVYITAGHVHVLDYRDTPDIPGTPTSPLIVTLNADSSGRPGQSLAGPDTISASGHFVNGGEWVSAELGYLHESGEPLWLCVEWPSTNPFMPKLGADASSPDHQSYAGYESGSQMMWSLVGEYDIMMRLGILENTKDSPLIESDSAVDSFTVYGRDRLPLEPLPQYRDTSSEGQVLHARARLDFIDNYFCVTAWDNGIEGECSDVIHIAGKGGPSAPVSIRPRNADVTVVSGSDTTIAIRIKNLGSTNLNYNFHTISMFSTLKLCDFPISVFNGVGTLEPLETDSALIVIHSSNLPLGHYWQFCQADFSDDEHIFLPEDVSISLLVDEYTDADIPADAGQLPRLILRQNVPNPFNSETIIVVENPRSLDGVSLEIYDVLGRRVADIQPAEALNGFLEFRWDGTAFDGSACPTGLYFYRASEGTSEIRKMLLLK